MKRALIGLAVFASALACGSASRAQSAPPAAAEASPPAPSKTVTVIAKKLGPPPPVVTIQKFVNAYAAPSGRDGKIGRWGQAPVCPMTVGLKPELDAVVTERVKDVAAMVGAPGAKDKCDGADIAIIFTTQPQALLDKIAAKREELLGFHRGPIEAERLAKVTQPVQAWYLTATKDAEGATTIDYCQACQAMGAPVAGWPFAPGVPIFQASASNLGDGLTSEFAFVTIVVDVGKTTGLKLNSVADYIAVLALSRAAGADTCINLPSISNLLASTCDASLKADALTNNDIAYLKALYEIQDPGLDVNLQQAEIAAQMRKDLGGH